MNKSPLTYPELPFHFLKWQLSRGEAETTLEHSDDDPKGEALAEYLCQSLGLARLYDETRA